MAPRSIDSYIASFPPKVRAVLKKVRAVVRKAAPRAEEKISYGIPAFAQNGVLVYFAGFKNHIGLYPPVRDPKLKKAASKYAGGKGNLRFPLDQPLPYGLIARIVKARLRENLAKAGAKRGPGTGD
jgi:uncharacterized protein YdhG (YjbR/CyaY superfamily)